MKDVIWIDRSKNSILFKIFSKFNISQCGKFVDKFFILEFSVNENPSTEFAMEQILLGKWRLSKLSWYKLVVDSCKSFA